MLIKDSLAGCVDIDQISLAGRGRMRQISLATSPQPAQSGFPATRAVWPVDRTANSGTHHPGDAGAGKLLLLLIFYAQA